MSLFEMEVNRRYTSCLAWEYPKVNELGGASIGSLKVLMLWCISSSGIGNFLISGTSAAAMLTTLVH